MDSLFQADVVNALRNSRKGKLKYDRTWHAEGRTQEILDTITKTLTTLSINSEALDTVKADDSLPESDEKPEEQVQGNKKVTGSPLKAEIGDSESDDESYYLKHVCETELPIVEYEAERLKSSKQILDAKQEEFEKFNHVLQKQVEQQYNIVKQKRELEVLQRKIEQQRVEQACLKDIEESLKIPEQANAEFGESASANREAELKAKLEAERKNKEQEELMLQLESLHQSLLCNLVPKITEKIEHCERENYLNLPYVEWKSLVANFLQVFQAIAQNAASGSLTASELEKCQAILKHAENLLKDVSLAAVNKQFEKERENQNKIVSSSIIIPDRSRSLTHSSVEVPNSTAKDVDPASAKVEDVDAMEDEECSVAVDGERSNLEQPTTAQDVKKSLVSQCTDVSAYRSYCSIQKSMKELDESLESFRSDPQQKKYRLMLHKAVAINTISDASGSQLREKVRQLVSLLSGQMVECGGKYTSVKEHPLAQSYCMNLLAEKLVTQGEEQVGSKVAAAFPFACVAVTICSKFPDLKQLILGHFYTKCPYLVPYYPVKEENQADDSYCMALGYKFIDGKREEKTNFLKRMHGYMALYAAMIQSDSVMGYPHQDLFTLKDGWKWIARALNVDPRPDITATILLAFLEVVGHAMLRTYDKQFKKILHFLCKDFYPRMKQVTPPSCGGPVGRLYEFLHNAIKKGSIPCPEGIISPHFWRT